MKGRFAFNIVSGLMLCVIISPSRPSTFAQTPVPKVSAPGKLDSFEEAVQLQKAGQLAKAANVFALFSRSNPRDPRVAEALYKEGECHSKLVQPDDALRCWNSVVQKFPKSPLVPEALEQSILIYEKRANPQAASALSDKLLSAFPSHPSAQKILVNRVDAAMTSRRYQEVVKLLGPIGDSAAPHLRKQLELARLFEEAKIDPAKLLPAADNLLQAKDFQGTLAILEAFIAANPGSSHLLEAKVKLGWANYCLQEPKTLDRAESLWEEVIRKGAKSDLWVGESQWHMIQLLAGPRGKWKEAVERCELIAKSTAPGTFRNEQALYTRAWLLWTQKQWATSLDAFNELIKVYPAKAEQPPIVAYIQDCQAKLKTKTAE